MKLILSTTKSQNNKLVKTYMNETEFEGKLREECNIISPTFILKCPISKLVNFNYAYIPSFKRYYYIKNINSIKSNLTEIDLTVDVLMSHKDDIRECSGVVSRQEYNFNKYLDDPNLLSETECDVRTLNFENSIEGNPNDSLVLVVVNFRDTEE